MPSEITRQDRENAEQLLINVLKSEFGESIDLTKGTAARDLLVTGISIIFAHLKKSTRDLESKQALRKLAQLPPSTNRDEAIEDTLSNIFITRKEGQPSRGPIKLRYPTRPSQVTVNSGARFKRSTALQFVLDTDEPLVYLGSELVVARDNQGMVIGFDLTLNVVSDGTGPDFDIEQGTFVDVDGVTPSPARVFSEVPFSGGKAIETVPDLLDRAEDALTIRGFVSPRSIRTTLRDLFPSIVDAFIVGFGDPEMYRDSMRDAVTPQHVHAGGKVDVYLKGSLLENRTFEGVVGGSYTSSKPEVNLFRDDALTLGSSGQPFTDSANLVTVGAVLRIHDPGENESSLYTIQEVHPYYLRISDKAKFPEVRDDITYSIGTAHPDYENIIDSRITGQFSRTLQEPGSIFLPPTPINIIKSVQIEDTTGPVVEWVTIPNRVNHHDPALLTVGTDYFVHSHNPVETPSANQHLELHVGEGYDGSAIKVRYDTIQDFTAVHSYARDRFNRNLCADVLIKGMHVAVVKPILMYTLKPLADAPVDADALKKVLADFITDFPIEETLNLSDIIHFTQAHQDVIGSVVPYYAETLVSGSTGSTAYPNNFSALEITSDHTGHFLVLETGANAGTYAIRETDVVNGNVTLASSLLDSPFIEDDLLWKIERRIKYGINFDVTSPDGRVIPYKTQNLIRVERGNLVHPSDPLYALDTPGTPSSIALGISLRTLRYICTPDLIRLEMAR